MSVVEDISIELKKGEIVSLLGVSGVGKTTLFNILSGLLAPDEGKVFLKCEDITGKPGSVSYMLQKDLLLPHKKIIGKRLSLYSRNLDWKAVNINIRVSYLVE